MDRITQHKLSSRASCSRGAFELNTGGEGLNNACALMQCGVWLGWVLTRTVFLYKAYDRYDRDMCRTRLQRKYGEECMVMM